jgi:subtilisin-like proprotein convertase family protein
MSTSNSDPAFDNGITNGAEWYAINGGMQDWSYVWHGGFDITLEVSNAKWPSASTLPGFWTDNFESMLVYMERVHEGVRGIVTDATTGLPVFAEIRVDGNPFPDYTDPDVGDYHRLLLPGSYSLEVSAAGYATQVFPITVASGAAVRYDVGLQPQPLQYYGNRVDDGALGDGYLAAGEVADLAVTLRNLGGAVSGIGGRLVTTGWFAQVTRDDATYADLATGASAESDAPHYGVNVDPAIPPGHKLGFAVEWQAAEASGLSDTFFLDVGACETAAAGDVPQPISDNQTTTSFATSSTTFAISEVRVAVDITHTYIGDLQIVLSSPEGTPVVLHSGTGGSANDIVGIYGDDLTPAESLSLLAGESPTGVWKLEVTDKFAQDTGTLNAWSLELCDRPAETSTPEMRFAAISIDAGDVELEWWSYPGMTSYRLYRSTDPTSAGSFVQVADTAATSFTDSTADPVLFWIVTAVGAQGEGAKGHFGE